MDYSLLLMPFEQPLLILLLALGTFLGIYVGAIPGLSATMAISLLVSLTFGWDSYSAIALMTGVFVGAVYGGSRSAILLNIPGAPAAVVTGFDGYPLAQKGEAGKTMFLAAFYSVIGTILGALALLFLAPAISGISMKFRSVDYLILAMIGLLTVGSVGCKSLRRGVFSACLGVLIGTVGMDALSSVKRFTFGITYLNSGVSFVVAMIGLFGASEVFVQLGSLSVTPVRQSVTCMKPTLKEFLHHLPLAVRSAVIGIFVGALPGAGGDIAALLSYDSARRTVRSPSAPFGSGAVEGVIAPETANNAAIGGAFVPMLTLGIPGDSVTAIYISALTLAGLTPGPGFLSSSQDIFLLVVMGLLLAAVFLMVFSLSGIRLFTKITQIPKAVLLPLILILSVIGAYAINNSVTDILWMFLFGILGYILKRTGYPVSPVVLGIVLEPLLESNLIRALKLNGSSAFRMLLSVFDSPISVILVILLILSLCAKKLTDLFTKGKEKNR